MTTKYRRTTSARFISSKTKSIQSGIPSEKTTRNWEQTFKILAATISLIGISLTLLGYGFVLGLTDTFGLDVTDVYRSPIDFLLASKDTIVISIDRFSKIDENQNIRQTLLFSGTILALAFLLCYFICKIFLNTPEKRKKVKTKADSFLFTVLTTVKKFHLDYPFVAISSFIAPWVLVRGVFLLIQFIIAVIALFPIFGFFAGRLATQENILMPVHCQSYAPTKPRSPKKVEGGAICLRILNKDGEEISRGRRIARTADQLFLYNSINGKTMSIPLRDARVEQVLSE